MHLVPNWSDTLSVGNRKIDAEHRQILESCRRIVDLCASAAPMNAQHHVAFNDFAEALLQHVHTEEQVLHRNGCPRLEQHKAEHSTLCEHLSDLLFQAIEGRLNSHAWIEVARQWSNHHLHDCDLNDRLYLHEP